MTRDEYRECMSGPLGSIQTPFQKDGSLDLAGTRKMVDVIIENGAKTIIITTGDSHCTVLTESENAQLTEVVVEQAAGRALIAASAWWWTGKNIEFAKYAREIGADLLIAFPPDWEASCTARTFADYYAAVAEHIPVLLLTCAFSPREMTVGREAMRILRDEVPGVVAVKDDICGEFGRRICMEFYDHWPIFAGGAKRTHLNALPYGIDGFLSNYIDYAPQIPHDYWQAVQTGDLTTARGIIRDYDIPLFDSFAALPGGVDAGIHGALELFGICERWRRPPYYSLNDEEMELVADFFRQRKLL